MVDPPNGVEAGGVENVKGELLLRTPGLDGPGDPAAKLLGGAQLEAMPFQDDGVLKQVAEVGGQSFPQRTFVAETDDAAKLADRLPCLLHVDALLGRLAAAVIAKATGFGRALNAHPLIVNLANLIRAPVSHQVLQGEAALIHHEKAVEIEIAESILEVAHDQAFPVGVVETGKSLDTPFEIDRATVQEILRGRERPHFEAGVQFDAAAFFLLDQFLDESDPLSGGEFGHEAAGLDRGLPVVFRADGEARPAGGRFLAFENGHRPVVLAVAGEDANVVHAAGVLEFVQGVRDAGFGEVAERELGSDIHEVLFELLSHEFGERVFVGSGFAVVAQQGAITRKGYFKHVVSSADVGLAHDVAKKGFGVLQPF